MGLFKSLLKKAEETTAPAFHLSDFPDLYTGMKVEVMTPANALLFVGRLRLLQGGDILEIRGEGGGYLPRGVYNQPVKLRMFQRDGTAITLTGAVGQNSFDFWRIQKLSYLQNSENRSYYRQYAGVDGWVESLTTAKGQRFPCTVLDISAGGARVLTSKLFQLGVTFQLEAPLIPGEEPIIVKCKVLRTMVRSQSGSPVKKFEYGCQFEELTPRMQERLTQSVFTLQRRGIQKSRR